MGHALPGPERGAADTRRIERMGAQMIKKARRDGEIVIVNQSVFRRLHRCS